MGGDRVVDLFAGDVKTEDLVSTLRPLLQSWANDRGRGESLSDYYQRLLRRAIPRQGITGRETTTRELIQLEIVR